MSMAITADKGTIIVYANPNAGYARDQIKAEKHLRLHHQYTVAEAIVGDWQTGIILQEVPGETFNSVMFDDV